jgi:hypothetical protein
MRFLELSRDGEYWHHRERVDPARGIAAARAASDRNPDFHVRVLEASHPCDVGGEVVFKIPPASRAGEDCRVEQLALLLRQDLCGVPPTDPWASPSERALHRQAVVLLCQRLGMGPEGEK